MGLMKVDTGFNLHNKFEIEVVDAKTGKVKQKETSYNIVVNQMFTRLCAGNTYFTGISYGTGTGTPDVSRTGLFTYLGYKAADIIETKKDFVNNEFFIRKRIQIMPEEHVGSYLTEVGVAYGTGNSITTHAMITDSEGHPISIYKTDLDVINIYATVYIEPQFTDPNIKLIDGTFMNYMLAQNTTAFTACGVTSYLSYGDRLGVSQAKSSSFTADAANKRRTSGVMRFSINESNYAINHMRLSGDVAHIYFPITGVHEDYPVTRTLGIGDGIKTRFRLPDFKPNPASVQMFLDDVEETGFTTETVVGTPYKHTNPNTGLPNSGTGVAITPDGSRAVAVNSGTAPYITFYEYNSGTDRYERMNAVDTGLPNHGQGVAITSDGSRAVAVNTSISPFITFYEYNSSTDRYEQMNAVDTGLPNSGYGVAITSDGSRAVAAHSNTPFITFYGDLFNQVDVIFATPPAAPKEIKASYTVNHVPKDSDHVFDIQYRIQFGTP